MVSARNDKIFGVVPVLVTPLLEDGSIDVKGIADLYEYLQSANVEAYWALGSTGEEARLCEKELHAYISFISSRPEYAKRTIIGTGKATAWQVMEFLDTLDYEVFKGVHFLSKDTKQSDSRFESEICWLADQLKTNLWLYNNIQRGKELSENVIEKVSRHPNVSGVKYGARNHMPFIKATKFESDSFQVLSAGHFYFSALSWGCQASTTSDACLIPQAYQKLSALFKQGKTEDARRLAYELMDFSKLFPRTDNGESAAEIKYALSLLGICKDYVAPGSRKLNSKEKYEVEKILPIIERWKKCV